MKLLLFFWWFLLMSNVGGKVPTVVGPFGNEADCTKISAGFNAPHMMPLFASTGCWNDQMKEEKKD